MLKEKTRLEHVPVLVGQEAEDGSLAFTQIFFHGAEHRAELVQTKNHLVHMAEREL